MKTLILLGSLIMLAFGSAFAQDSPPEDENQEAVSAAIAAAERWLAIVDSAGWLQSHTEASALFKNAVAPDVWVRQIKAARTPLGRVLSRTLAGSQFATSLPGAPDGEYVVLTFSAQFENKASAVETITPMKDTDGTWRVSGYYIK